jgi:hypothetical protein
MTEGAYAIHVYMGKSDDSFYGKIQAITVAFNGLSLDFFTHYAGKTNGAANIKYYRYPLFSDAPWLSLEHFQTPCKHLQNAQDVGEK